MPPSRRPGATNQKIPVEVTVDRAGSGWSGHVGVITTLVRHMDGDPRNAVALVCRPAVTGSRSMLAGRIFVR